MEENKKQIYKILEKTNDPKIISNILQLVTEYVNYYSNHEEKNEEN